MTNTALITGASAGIGLEFARIHAAKGGDLVLVARREDKLRALADELASKYSVQTHVIAADLSDAASPQAIYDAVQAKGLEIDVLINNAGFGGQGAFVERDWADDAAMIQVNVMSLAHLTRLFLPSMVERNKGKVLNVSSTASLVPGPLQAVYFASKAFVTSFSNALASELDRTNVTVTALLPGATETEFAAVSGMDKTSLFSAAVPASDVAQTGYDAMEAGKLETLAGLSRSQRITMALAPFMPKKRIMKQIRSLQRVKK